MKGVDQGHSSPDGGEGKGNKVNEEEGVAQAAADGRQAEYGDDSTGGELA